MNLDHVFIVFEDHDIAIARTDRRGVPLYAFANRVSPDENFRMIARRIEQTVFEGYDRNFAVVASKTSRAMFKSEWREWMEENAPILGKPSPDIRHLAWPFVHAGIIPTNTLDSIAAHFRITNTAPNTATGDCDLLVRSYWALMNRYYAALRGEEVIREIGGTPLAVARKFMGL